MDFGVGGERVRQPFSIGTHEISQNRGLACSSVIPKVLRGFAG